MSHETEPASLTTLMKSIDPGEFSAEGTMQIRRQKLHEPTVEKYALRMLGGEVFPPIRAVRNPTGNPLRRFVVYDGHHRLAAVARAEAILREFHGNWNGVTEVPLLDALILEGKFNVNQILCLAYEANAANGLAVGQAEKKRYFKAFIDSGQYRIGIERYMQLRELGQKFGVSHTTIRGWLMRDHKRVWDYVYSREDHKPKHPPNGRTGMGTMQKNLWERTEDNLNKLKSEWLELKAMGSTKADAALEFIEAQRKEFEVMAEEAGLKPSF
jgi:hypothetical protein